MEIPSKIRIGSVDYDVKLTDEVLVLNSQQCKGTIDFEFNEIKISNSVQDIQNQEQTLLHELIHGMVHDRKIDFKNMDEESIVDGLALELHQVIRDNPNMFHKRCVGGHEASVGEHGIKIETEQGPSNKFTEQIVEEVARKLGEAFKIVK